MLTSCEFSEPLYFDNTNNVFRELKAGENPIHYGNGYAWSYHKLVCQGGDLASSTIYSYVKNQDTGGEFYIQKTLTYGEAITIWFLTLFTFYLIFKAGYNFFWKK